jgi:tetratricopeptide (TPR) repeat protein
MLCSKCGTENSEDSLFCHKCGAPLSKVIERGRKPTRFNNKVKIILGSVILIAGIIIGTGVVGYNNPVSEFKRNISSNQEEEAVTVYNEKIKGDTEKETKVYTFLKDEIAEIQKSYFDEKIDYTSAKTRLDTIKKTQLASSEVDSALNKMDKLYFSRLAFKKAEEFFKNKDLENALIEYQKVIKEDKNYGSAQEQIANNEKEYKNLVLKDVEESANKKEYGKAVRLLTEALTVFPKDADFIAKQEVYQKAEEEKIATERKQQLEDLKAKQELAVNSTKVVPDFFSLYDQGQVIVKNMTNKVIKKFTVGMLLYDQNGYPLKSGILAGESELVKGEAESVNIQPGQSFGSDSAWNLDRDYGTVKKIIACVVDVEYYDGSTWTNDYYSYWQEEYQGKPYK